MGYEVELKYRLVDHDRLRERLVEFGATVGPTIEQADIYLSHPARDFAATNEAFRIRRIGAENRITYKGPRLSAPTKTREEIEISFTEGEEAFQQLLRLLENLGFQRVTTIRKVRVPLHIIHEGRDIEVALDTVAEIGEFAEIETLAATERELPAAQAAVLALAKVLGLTEVEPRSYLRMTLEAK